VNGGLGVCGFGHDVGTSQELTTVQNHPIDTTGWGRVGFPSNQPGPGSAEARSECRGEIPDHLGHRFN
jgi:hypothetical protein